MTQVAKQRGGCGPGCHQSQWESGPRWRFAAKNGRAFGGFVSHLETTSRGLMAL